METLQVNEIFLSIQGEGKYAGYPCLFVRLKGCPLRCSWCDTGYAFYEGSEMPIEEILSKLKALRPGGLVQVTGGEPLLQKNVYPFLEMLLENGYSVLLETSGAISIADVSPRVHIALDIKPPGSGESEKNVWENLKLLKPTDDLKIVITDKKDFDWTLNVLEQHSVVLEMPPVLQPAFAMLPERELAGWILDSGKDFRLGLQLHKYIYSPDERGV